MLIGNYKLATQLIKKYDSIVIFHHIRPDGDCLGSQFALKELIEQSYKNKKVYAVGDSEGSFSFLDINHDQIPSDEILSKSLAIIVDANFKDRIKCRELLDKEIFPEVLRIDHHPNDDDLYNCTRWVDSSYVAADEMITYMAYKNDWKITQRAANLMYLGINTDSGRFLYNNTTDRTLDLVAFLYRNKLDADFIHKNLSKTTLNDLKFNAWLMSTLKTRNGVAYIQNDYETTKSFNKTPNQSIRVNSIGNIDGFPIWVQFTEEEDKRIRVEFRSNGPIVRNVALKWGGGGHERASGCIINSFDDLEKVIDDCAQEVLNYNNK